MADPLNRNGIDLTAFRLVLQNNKWIAMAEERDLMLGFYADAHDPEPFVRIMAQIALSPFRTVWDAKHSVKFPFFWFNCGDPMINIAGIHEADMQELFEDAGYEFTIEAAKSKKTYNCKIIKK